MPEAKDLKTNDEIAWCPGCGNFGILNAMKKTIARLDRNPKDIVFVSGIGQAAKLPHYIKCNCFNGLHGRALPVAAAIKMANHTLTVLVSTGDGDCYGEGGNHFIHNIRRNIDITVVVHNNQIYGLTKGQASPTTDPGYETKFQPEGVILEPLYPLEMAIAMGAGFVARGYALDLEHLSWLILEGIHYKGFALIDVLQPCVTFNKKNTFDWYSKRVYKINDDSSYNPQDKISAFRKASEWGDRIPIGIVYKTEKETYEERSGIKKRPPLVEEQIENIDIREALKEFI
ncbi:MAG: 2-oxoacid:ferredoxin oxidoreductase subunit beta [Candidatus Jettenia sp.]|uniref:2-oxoglutarate ferredoxin oxidoreductase beta subunit n=1 Tax=Candidatus Jettenia caeni TaxID=247490 RepID=I3IGZ7_9BACT|nr:2-oxoacid:ferredoxin oxidoreductase subunit beta [Candidatus Jettenia sp. AMX1]MBC6929048.1 2-oxoacid:ferredoxin oxidoreductase subunit beta [Candidatus Jettenia sp.]NUN23546.1 2-oxoacid:ferredoxin oxidoreductase subunit beta [Candidatus Jettenia caeni]KAA0249332.1 MAG: 2-oxoacid:ferredoxin oxidoreductase subunit beta [Candidatus Jettenia sp. AMX1]MCE7881479.1 2-oxoacid:ferredoxin oxidoreductase subunit beta [Candidatus Jettenia sp. AMX1]MCQ3928035.1 2-oxoacid:ferredoxin oxidoreductase subu